MSSTFEITHDRDFLQHFLTNWRTKSISPQMVEILKENSKSDPYAAYGYGRWLSLLNPDGNSLKKRKFFSCGQDSKVWMMLRMWYVSEANHTLQTFKGYHTDNQNYTPQK